MVDLPQLFGPTSKFMDASRTVKSRKARYPVNFTDVIASLEADCKPTVFVLATGTTWGDCGLVSILFKDTPWTSRCCRRCPFSSCWQRACGGEFSTQTAKRMHEIRLGVSAYSRVTKRATSSLAAVAVVANPVARRPQVRSPRSGTEDPGLDPVRRGRGRRLTSRRRANRDPAPSLR